MFKIGDKVIDVSSLQSDGEEVTGVIRAKYRGYYLVSWQKGCKWSGVSRESDRSLLSVDSSQIRVIKEIYEKLCDLNGLREELWIQIEKIVESENRNRQDQSESK